VAPRDRRGPLRGAARGLAALALLAAVLLMHTAIGLPEVLAHADHPEAGHAVRMAAAPVADVQLHPAPGASCDAPGGCGTHSMLHLCLAILGSALAAVALLALAIRGPRSVPRMLRLPRGYAAWGRAPPWTVVSLSQLSVLRV